MWDCIWRVSPWGGLTPTTATITINVTIDKIRVDMTTKKVVQLTKKLLMNHTICKIGVEAQQKPNHLVFRKQDCY